ncbi:MAG: M23 family metallopeptidase [Oscillospiraceae bacterium]|jgi:murein DD-endopeptidase MepM/ murein hydrolase activator NlpD|nr:M23 family metallopeptidase [Oscillospiraceae bacterium]
MYDEQPFEEQFTDELEAIRERRRQREAYRADYGDDDEPQKEWWLPLLLKQVLTVAVLVGFVFAAKAAADGPFGELREEYGKIMSINMEWAEIFAQIGDFTKSVFAVDDSTRKSSDAPPEGAGDEKTPTRNVNAEEDTENNAPTQSTEHSTNPAGGATLPEPTGLSFAPIWVSTKAVFPVNGSVSSGFGLRANPVTHKLGWHGGMDIAADAGTEIVAAYPGIVHRVSADEISGNYVTLNHGRQGNISEQTSSDEKAPLGFQTFYCHASKILVHEGDTVEAGQPIAVVGSTGQATGPHLHIELRLNGLCYDPAGVLG